MKPEMMDGIPRPIITPKPPRKRGAPDWVCLVASGAIEGPVKTKQKITRARTKDFLSGFGLGLFVGGLAIFILLGQLSQWGE